MTSAVCRQRRGVCVKQRKGFPCSVGEGVLPMTHASGLHATGQGLTSQPGPGGSLWPPPTSLLHPSAQQAPPACVSPLRRCSRASRWRRGRKAGGRMNKDKPVLLFWRRSAAEAVQGN